MTITDTYSDVAPPPGADLVDSWETGAAQPYRVVFGVDRLITDSGFRVYATVIQLPDGSIDTGTIEEPNITMSDNERDGPSFNVDQARELAAVLLEAVRDIKRWVTR